MGLDGVYKELMQINSMEDTQEKEAASKAFFDRLNRMELPGTFNWAEEIFEGLHLKERGDQPALLWRHLETDEEIIEHVHRLRQLQDETGGFTAFIPWSCKPGNTDLQSVIPRASASLRYLRILAVARLYLDNVPHIQASWFSEGKGTGQLALHFGADDFGGVLLEENVHRSADYVNTANENEVRTLISEAGFRPRRRDTLYRPVAS